MSCSGVEMKLGYPIWNNSCESNGKYLKKTWCSGLPTYTRKNGTPEDFIVSTLTL
jgi:hypothetical protein